MDVGKKHGELSRRSVLGAIAGGTVIATLGTAAGAHAATLVPASHNAPYAPHGTTVSLGPAMLTISMKTSKAGVLADGTPVMFAYNYGNPAQFNVIRLDTGALVDTFSMAPWTVGACPPVQHPDGSVYLSGRLPNDGTLLRYVPGQASLDVIGAGIVGEQMMRTIVIDPDTGTVYGSTYPNAKVFSFDPSTGDIHDYGRMVTDGEYAWGFEWVNGKLWVGTGIGTAHLIELDPSTGAKTEIALPAEFSGATYIYSIKRRGDVVLVSVAPSVGGTNLLVYDLVTGSWGYPDSVHQPVSHNGLMSEVDSNGVFYYFADDDIYSYDTATHSTASTGFAASALADRVETTRNVDVFEQNGQPYLVGGQDDGQVWHYDLAAGTGTAIETDVVGSPATVQSIGVGPDGKIYTGAYLSSGVMARIDPQTQQIEQLKGPQQGDVVFSHDNHIVITSYPNAIAYYGTVDNWDWGTNPSQLFALGRFSEYGQDRMHDVVSAGDNLVFGTVPNYGELGGALVFATTAGDVTVHRNVVQDQSISALAIRGQEILGGTSIHGGLSSVPTAAEAALFIWDTAQNQKVYEGVPVAGATVLHSLFVRGSSVFGIVDTGVIFEFDIPSRTIVRTVDTGIVDTNIWGRTGNLYYHEESDAYFGSAGSTLFRLDPATFAVTVLVNSSVKFSTLAPNGDIFYSNNNEIFVYTP